MKLKSSLAALLGLLATLTLVLSHSFDNADIVAASGTDFLVDKQSPSPFAPGHKKTSKRDGTGPGNDENDYNRQNPLNPIPDNVVMFATVTMQQRIPRTMFNRTEIWQALNVRHHPSLQETLCLIRNMADEVYRTARLPVSTRRCRWTRKANP